MGLHAEKHLVPGGILLAKIVGIVGGDDGEPRLPGNPDNPLVRPGLFGKGVVHHLKVEVPLPQKLLVVASLSGRLLFLPLKD